MRIRVISGEDNIHLILPTGLIFSKASQWVVNKVARKYAPEALKDIPPEAMDAMFAELRRIKRRYGKWVLVEAESGDGDQVVIQL